MLYDAHAEALSWDERLLPERQLTLVTAVLHSAKLSLRARREAILSLSHWASQSEKEWQQQVLVILGDIAAQNDTPDIRFLALEQVGRLGGVGAVADWWANKQDNHQPEGIKLLARLWDRGLKVSPTNRKTRWSLYQAILEKRWQQRKGYIVYWILYGTISSLLTGLITGLLAFFPLDISAAVLFNTAVGLVLSFGLAWGELFEGWLKVVVRIIAGLTATSLIGMVVGLILIPNAFLDFFLFFMAPAALFVLAIGIGTGLGDMWVRRAGIGHLVFGCFGAGLIYGLINVPIYGLIGLGVVIGTGIASILKRPND